MKKILSSLLVSSLAIALGTYAEIKPIECGAHKSLGENTCDVCYSETFLAKQAPEGWSSTITDLTIPWIHAGSDLDEIIYDNEQKLPEIKSTLTVSTNPQKPEELWKNHETLIWKPFDDHKEFVIKKGEQVGLYRLSENASLTIQGKKPDDTFIIKTPLFVGNFNSATNEETEPKVRNICILGTVTIEKPVPVSNTAPAPAPTPLTPPAPVTPAPISTAEAIEKSEAPLEEETIPETLNAAGPEPVVAATAQQTETQSGPALWIILLLTFALASAWQAWQKQKS